MRLRRIYETTEYAPVNKSTPCFRRATPLPAYGRACYHSGGLPPNSPASRRARSWRDETPTLCIASKVRQEENARCNGKSISRGALRPPERAYTLQTGGSGPGISPVVKTPQNAANLACNQISNLKILLQFYNSCFDARVCVSL